MASDVLDQGRREFGVEGRLFRALVVPLRMQLFFIEATRSWIPIDHVASLMEAAPAPPPPLSAGVPLVLSAATATVLVASAALKRCLKQ